MFRSPTVAAALLAGLLACKGEEPKPTPQDAAPRGAAPAVEPAAPALRRLTQTQYANAVSDLFAADLYIPTNLEPDNEVEGLLSLGASTTSVSSYGVELYEAAARTIAEQIVEDPELYARVVPCSPAGADDADCADEALGALARRAWRRPLEEDERASLSSLVATIGGSAGSFATGVEYGIAAVLQSPHFLYRVEHGAGDGAARPLTDWELASRLSFLLWNSIPDEDLLDAAASGALQNDDGLAAQAERMLEDDRAVEGIRNLFDEVFHLYELEEINKDPTVFTHAHPDMGVLAREETLRVLEDLILEEDADFRTLLTTRETFVDRRLAALYNVPAPVADGFGAITLPDDGSRRGLLGQASFLLAHSHPTSSSATKRGKFVRVTLLCQDIPQPPADVDTSIPEADADSPTLRERIQTHLEDPACAGCHSLTDPIGLAFENFDGMGRWRDTENGALIDPSGDLDGEGFADSWELGAVLSEHDRYGYCMSRHLYRYAVGRLESDSEENLLDWLAAGLEETEFSYQSLLLDVILSDGFRTVGEVQ